MQFIYNNNPTPLLLLATAYFFIIYLLSASLVSYFAKLNNQVIEKRVIPKHQVRTELFNSMRSILLFGGGMIVPWLMLQHNITAINQQASIDIVLLDIVILILWNDIHFYAVHRFLHSKLKWAHITHHQSVVATPFAAYSMSAIEAALLGSVMPIAMLAHDFSLTALAFLPLWSITINAIAHSNNNFFPQVSDHSLLNVTRHHQSHHSSYHGNYSFFFNQLDRLCGTSRPFKN